MDGRADTSNVTSLCCQPQTSGEPYTRAKTVSAMVKQNLAFELKSLHEFFNRSTAELTEADSGFRPTEDMMTAASQIAHAASTIDWFIDGAFKPEGFDLNFEPMVKVVNETTSIEAARKWFNEAVARAQQSIDAHTDEEWMMPLAPGPVMGGAPRAAIFSGMNDHTAHHRGALTVYARLLKKVPPMPYM